jgi:hypothetical protein
MAISSISRKEYLKEVKARKDKSEPINAGV